MVTLGSSLFFKTATLVRILKGYLFLKLRSRLRQNNLYVDDYKRELSILIAFCAFLLFLLVFNLPVEFEDEEDVDGEGVESESDEFDDEEFEDDDERST